MTAPNLDPVFNFRDFNAYKVDDTNKIGDSEKSIPNDGFISRDEFIGKFAQILDKKFKKMKAAQKAAYLQDQLAYLGRVSTQSLLDFLHAGSDKFSGEEFEKYEAWYKANPAAHETGATNLTQNLAAFFYGGIVNYVIKIQSYNPSFNSINKENKAALEKQVDEKGLDEKNFNDGFKQDMVKVMEQYNEWRERNEKQNP